MSPGVPRGRTRMGITIRVGAGLSRAAIPALCADLAERLRGRPTGVVTCEVPGGSRPDVVTAEALARLRLTARRHGWRLEVDGIGPDLRALLELLGLTGALPEAAGQPEEREQPAGVEEVVEPGDPAA